MYSRFVLLLLSLAPFITSSPLNSNHNPRSVFDPFNPCTGCFRSSWTQGAECKTNTILLSTISRLTNPPAEATSTYTPTKWCTYYLRQTDWSRVYTTTSKVSTYTSWTIEHLFVTKTDLDHPTSTMLCPIPSSGMECGWDSNTIAPIDQGEDWSIEHFYNPTECQQVCLERSACRAYRVDGSEREGWSCEIFNVGLGTNATNVRNPTPSGSQWWDRNCQAHVPSRCKSNSIRTAPPSDATTLPVLITTTQDTPTSTPSFIIPSQPDLTPAPTPAPRAKIAKRDVPFPDYFSDLSYVWSSIWVTPACSCLITSALPPTLSTTTSTATSWTSSQTVSSTFEDWFTVTTTPRETTVYVSAN